jgi:hypothetical protein
LHHILSHSLQHVLDWRQEKYRQNHEQGKNCILDLQEVHLFVAALVLVLVLVQQLQLQLQP